MTIPSEVIQTTSLADEIGFRLQTAILDGVYPPGTHLLQEELCTRFGVSRTPIREALRKLQAQHLVVLVPNKGATVRVPTRQELIDVYAVRAELEAFACQLACERVTEEMLDALDAAQVRIDNAVARREQLDDDGTLLAQVAHANDEFHALIARTANNERLRAIVKDLQRFFPKDHVWRAITSADELQALNVEEHQRIRKALGARDAAGAAREMRNHILHASRVLLEYLDRHGFWRE